MTDLKSHQGNTDGSPQNHLTEGPEMSHECEQRFCSEGEFDHAAMKEYCL